jgi:hypothetical protein
MVESYSDMLGDCLMPACDELGVHLRWFMQNSAPLHYALSVHHWLDENFTDRWIGQRGPMEWSPVSPHISPVDFSVCDYFKSHVYEVKIIIVEHLKEQIQAEVASINLAMLYNIHST